MSREASGSWLKLFLDSDNRVLSVISSVQNLTITNRADSLFAQHSSHVENRPLLYTGLSDEWQIGNHKCLGQQGLFLQSQIKLEHHLLWWTQGFELEHSSLECCYSMAQQALVGQGLLFIEASRSHSDTPYSVALLWTSYQPDLEICKQ